MAKRQGSGWVALFLVIGLLAVGWAIATLLNKAKEGVEVVDTKPLPPTPAPISEPLTKGKETPELAKNATPASGDVSSAPVKGTGESEAGTAVASTTPVNKEPSMPGSQTTAPGTTNKASGQSVDPVVSSAKPALPVVSQTEDEKREEAPPQQADSETLKKFKAEVDQRIDASSFASAEKSFARNQVAELKSLVRLTTVRFKEGHELEAREVDYLLQWIKAFKDNKGSEAGRLLNDSGAQIVVLGFASADGDFRTNQILSQKRAEYVRKELKKILSQEVLAVGIGQTSILSQTRKENRAAEVWIANSRND